MLPALPLSTAPLSCVPLELLAAPQSQGSRALSSAVPPVVQVQYNPDVTGPRHLIAAVEDAGFDAEAISIDRWAQLLGPSCKAFTPFTETSWLQQSLVLAALGSHQDAPSHGTALVTGSLGSSAAIWSLEV